MSGVMPAKKKKPATPRAPAKKPAPAPPPPPILRLEDFITAFADSVNREHDIRYCFVLGSGASFASGVPSGAQLVDRWLNEIHRARRPGGKEEDYQKWVTAEFASIKDFTWDNRHAFYGKIYKQRFPDNANGQTYLRKLMERKSPSFGYSVLARILAQTRHNLVITTNFDNLVRRYLDGETIDQIASSCGVSHGVVVRRFRSAGVEIRSRADYPSTTAAAHAAAGIQGCAGAARRGGRLPLPGHQAERPHDVPD